MTTKVVTGRTYGSGATAAEELATVMTGELGAASETNAAPALVVFFASTKQPLTEVAPILRARFPTATVIGTSTAGEFTEASEGGASLAGFAVAGDFRVFGGFATGLRDDPEAAVKRATAELPATVPGFPYRTALLLLDTLAGHGEEISLLVAGQLGVKDILAGGAAGDDLAMRTTHVALGAQVAADALVIAYIFSREPLGLGVAHGYEPISEAMTVTRSEGSRVFEIDGKPAWTVWADATRAHAAAVGLEPKNEGSFLFRYPAALKMARGHKMRAILSRNDDDSITFVTGIPVGTVIYVAEGEPLAQLASARKAARLARSRLPGKTIAGALVFDCVVRKLILGDDFGAAVRTISAELGDARVAGFDSYGEIALQEGDVSGFHNATSVVLAFPGGARADSEIAASRDRHDPS